MHMADALLSPAVGGAMWAATGALLAYSARRVRRMDDGRIVPLMGVLGAFVFAAQMINFSIPGTGSSGHIGGGMLLSILLGPTPAFIVIASVLTVQALFFADGGLLALGANVFNLGFFPCFIAYPLIFRPLMRGTPAPARVAAACILATVVGLLGGATGVVVETIGSGISSLPLTNFLLLMLPIHLAIGLVEGAATAALVMFIWRARPDLLDARFSARVDAAPRSRRPVLIGFVVAALAIGGVLSWFASTHPDGLEWSIAAVAGAEPEGPADGVHGWLSKAQHAVAMLPDYDFDAGDVPATGHATQSAPAWPEVSPGRSLAGVVGGGTTLLLVFALALLLRRRR